jgi:probable FeS assembly SUF system protein SufT
MNSNEPIPLTRDVEAVMVPSGTPVTLQQGSEAYVTQVLGGSYTVVVNGNMFRIDGQDADALGFEKPGAVTEKPKGAGAARTPEELEKEVWDQMRTCFDPEIPVNIVDLGLIYDCAITPLPSGNIRVEVKMTLTAPGCGMGEYIRQDVQNKLLCLEEVEDVNCELVWEPQWNQAMMSDAAKLQLGMY